MTAGSLLTILFYAWLIVSAAVAVVWYRRRTKSKAETQRNRLRVLNERDAERKSDATEVETENETEQAKVGVTAAAATGLAAHNGTGAHPETQEPINLNEFIFDSEEDLGTTTDEIDFSDGVDTGEIDTNVDSELATELESDVDTELESEVDTETDGPGADQVDPEIDGADVVDDEILGDGLSINDADSADNVTSEADTTENEDELNGSAVDTDAPAEDTSETTGDATSETTEEVADETGSDRLVLGSLPTDEDQPAPDLTGLLTEFDLPYDLEPLTDDRTEETEYGGHIALVSEHGDAAEVGTALADALVEIGYNFEPIGHDRGLAKRGSDLIALRIIPEVGESDVSERYAQSAVNDSSMVIEMWSGQAAVEAGAVSQV